MHLKPERKKVFCALALKLVVLGDHVQRCLPSVLRLAIRGGQGLRSNLLSSPSPLGGGSTQPLVVLRKLCSAKEGVRPNNLHDEAR
jgi:hypothetical protein